MRLIPLRCQPQNRFKLFGASPLLFAMSHIGQRGAQCGGQRVEIGQGLAGRPGQMRNQDAGPGVARDERRGNPRAVAGGGFAIENVGKQIRGQRTTGAVRAPGERGGSCEFDSLIRR